MSEPSCPSFLQVGARPISPAARPLRTLVRAYQHARAGRPSPCRFVPSCSEYALEALTTHGAVKGLALATWRVARCNPWGGHGYDPVPEKKARGHVPADR